MSGLSIFDFDASCRFLPCLEDGRRFDLTRLSGVCRYCDGEGRAALLACVEESGCRGVHWIGSGHYHYLTLLFLQQIQEPFALAVADLHTDMLAAPCAGLLSCGGWVREALETCPAMQAVVLLGVDDALAEAVPGGRWPSVRVIPRSAAVAGRVEDWTQAVPSGMPVYFSIDKDVLPPSDAVTDWGNGDLPLDSLLAWIAQVGRRHRVIGADVCGDTSCPEACLQGAAAVNDRSTSLLLETLGRAVEAPAYDVANN